MSYLKKFIDFMAVPFVIVGFIACLCFSAILTGWYLALEMYVDSMD